MSFINRIGHIIKRYFNTLRQINLFAMTATAILSFAVSYTIANPMVLNWMNSRVPPCVFSIEVLDDVNPKAIPNHEVWITKLSLDENEDMKAIFDSCEAQGFEFRSAGDYGYSTDMIINVAHEGSSLSLVLYDNSTLTCEFWKQNLSGIINVSVIRGDTVISEEKIDLYADSLEDFASFVTEIPEYESSVKYTIFRCGVITAGAVLVFLVIIDLITLLFNSVSGKPKSKKPAAADALSKLEKSSETITGSNEKVTLNDEVVCAPTLTNHTNTSKFGKITLGVFFSLLVLSIIVSSVLSTYIDKLSYRIVEEAAPEKRVCITVIETDTSVNGEVCLLDDYWLAEEKDEDNLFRYCVNGDQSGTWEYHEAQELSYFANSLTAVGENVGSSIVFYAPAIPTSYLSFYAHPGCGTVSVQVDDDIFLLDTNSETSSSPRILPFKNSYFPVIIRLFLFALLTVIVFILLLLLYRFLVNRKINYNKSILFGPYRKWSFWFIWIALYVFAAIQYNVGIPNYLQGGGDQIYYWGEALRDAWWHTDRLAESLVSFRGVLCNVPTLVAQLIGEALKIDPVFVYLIFTSLAIAWLVGYVLPELYVLLSEQEPKNIQVILSTLTYLFFWNGTLTAVLVDLFGAVTFLTGVLFAFKLLKKQKIYYGIICGAFWAVACNLRTAYQYGIYVIVGYGVCLCVYQIIKHRKKLIAFLKQMISIRWKCFAGVIVIAASFVIISIPQYQINVERGHYGFFPYSEKGNMYNNMSLVEYSALWSLKYYTGYPIQFSDDQMETLVEPEFGRDEVLNIPQILTAYSNNFMDTVVYVLKKIFVALDVKTNIAYPNEIRWRESPGMIYSLLNYIALASSVYVLVLSKKHVKLSERILMALLGIGLILPQMFVHVEWRYFLSTYILLYYFFSYHFVEEAVDSIRTVQTTVHYKYLRYICIVLCIAFTVSFTICA